MSKHRQPRRRYYRWQITRGLQYKAHLLNKWIQEQLDDLDDIIKQLINR